MEKVSNRLVLGSLAIIGRRGLASSIAAVVGSIDTVVDSNVFKKDPLNFITTKYYLMHQQSNIHEN